MVTAIRGLRGVRLGQRGRLERQLTEESALSLDDPTDSPPSSPSQAPPDQPSPETQVLQRRDVASSRGWMKNE